MGENLAAHLLATIVGAILIGVGVGMGVTVVMLPVGVPLGLIGLGVFCWGIWGFGEAKRRRMTPPE